MAKSIPVRATCFGVRLIEPFLVRITPRTVHLLLLLLLLLPLVFKVFDGVSRQLLPAHQVVDILLPRLATTDGDH